MTFAQTLPPPRSIDELDAADRDLDDVGVAVVTGVLDPGATADVRARLLDAADRSDARRHPDAGIRLRLRREEPARVHALRVGRDLRRADPTSARTPLREPHDRRLPDLELQRQRHRARSRRHVPARGPVLRAPALDGTVRRERGVAARRLHRRERRHPCRRGEPPFPSRLRRVPSRPSPSKDPPAASWSWTVGCGTRPARTEPSRCTALRLFGYYVQPWIRPQINWNAALPPDVAAGFDPSFRAMLGLDHGLTAIPTGR